MVTFSIPTNLYTGDLSGCDLSVLTLMSIFNVKICRFIDAPIPMSKVLTLYDISDNYILGNLIAKILIGIDAYYTANAPTVNCTFSLAGTNNGDIYAGVNNTNRASIISLFTTASKTATFTINAIETTTGSAAATYGDGNFTYSSSIDSITDLYAVYSYDSGFTADLPIVCFGHGFGGDADTITLAQMHTYAAEGFFVLNIGMRGRNDADGDKDASGREIYDLYDAIEYVKTNYALASNTKAAFVGFHVG